MYAYIKICVSKNCCRGPLVYLRAKGEIRNFLTFLLLLIVISVAFACGPGSQEQALPVL